MPDNTGITELSMAQRLQLPVPTYILQTCFQDDGWSELSRIGEAAHTTTSECGYLRHELGEAVRRAELVARDAIAYGMARVFRLSDGRVMAEFSAGHQPFDTVVGNDTVLRVQPHVDSNFTDTPPVPVDSCSGCR